MTDLRSEIANLRELNAKRTLGEWSVVRDRDNHWGMVEVTGPGVCGRLVIGFTVSTNVDSRRAQQIEADAELIAALANACDAGLLDAAERGLEAEAKLAFLKSKGLTVGIAKDDGLPERLAYVIEPGTCFDDADVIAEANDSYRKLVATEAQVERILAVLADKERECGELVDLIRRCQQLFPVEQPERCPLPGWAQNIKERVRHVLNTAAEGGGE